MSTIDSHIELEVLRRIKSKRSYVDYLADKLSCSKSEAKILGKQISDSTKDSTQNISEKIKEVKDKKGNRKYLYNPTTDDYIITSPNTGEVWTTKGSKVKWIISSYSGWAGKKRTKEEMSRLCGWTTDRFDEFCKLFEVTQTSLPVTDEDLDVKSDAEIASQLKGLRSQAIAQTFDKSEWDAINDEAEKYQKLTHNQINPFVESLSDINIELNVPLPELPFTSQVTSKDQVFMVCLSDLHFGAVVRKNEVANGVGYNLRRTVEIVDSYIAQIYADLNNRLVRPEHAVIVIIGDILHTLTGKTLRGTQLDYDRIGAEQFREAMVTMTRFTSRILQVFKTVEVQTVRGNHAGASESGLYYAISNAFINEDRIKFSMVDTRVNTFNVVGGFVMLDHGDSDVLLEKGRVPTADKARESYIRKRMDPFVKEWADATFKLFIQGDLHHYERKDYGGFEFIMLPAPIGVDKYTDHLNLRSQAAQKCFILTKNGIKEELTYTF